MSKLTNASLGDLPVVRPMCQTLNSYKGVRTVQDVAIQVKGLQKSYKQLHVLNGVNFEVKQGSIFALLGSNGAGKTTIVNILTTLLKQDSGTEPLTDSMFH